MARKRKHFWNHLVKEYLVNLRESRRTSTRYKSEVVRIGNVAIVHEEGSQEASGDWLML